MKEFSVIAGLITAVIGGITGLVFVIMHECNASDQQMIQAGYVKEMTPVQWTAHWVKKEPAQ